ncbi:MAG TPA: hypothetical protein DEU93_04580 [Chitinophagaceae bacterium]|nr:hypothetical protein [Chitinophagaceae bacterium]HML58208.1 hypothetical protein [Ferruginibacter sp.]
MKTTTLLLSAISITATTALAIYLIRKIKQSKRLKRIAEEGYETAIDILYPQKLNTKKLQYRPTIPA